MIDLGLIAALGVSTLFLAGSGALLLRVLRITDTSAFEVILYSVTLGTILLELAVGLGELAPNLRVGVRIAIVAVALSGLFEISTILRSLRQVALKLFMLKGVERFLAVGLLSILVVQGLASFAPLTGSDALHYHFTAQQLYLSDGFHAPWSLLHGFFCGLGHQLILAGLALGSGRLAQSWLFLGGAVGTLATLRLTQLWVGGVWPWLASLAFALTPVAFWQISIGGAPDVWMCAFVPLGLLAILKARANSTGGAIILSGILAGASAGTKYTGILLAAALFAGFFVAIRSAGKTAVFLLTATATGLWPYLRNLVWTGDPVFPFLFTRLHHSDLEANRFAIASILLDTGTAHTFSWLELLKFPLFAAVDQSHLGAWQLLGPLVLVFAPLAIWPLRKSIEGRVAMTIWGLGALGIGLTSAMSRFLLPLLPVALGASIAGLALLTQGRWRFLRVISVVSIVGFLSIGTATLAVYLLPAWSVVVGRTTPENYLIMHSPDYERSRFVDREVERFGQQGRVLIFFRHLYYVRVPFFNGDPEDSWELNPERLSTPSAWKAFFAAHQIRWVLKSPKYPATLASSLIHLEEMGVLTRCAYGEVESFSRNRIEGDRVRESITLYCVESEPSSH